MADVTIEDTTSSLGKKLDSARRELLDLSTRNRLIHVPRKSKSAKTVEIADEIAGEIFRLLVLERKAFTFVAGKRSPGAGQEADAQNPDGQNPEVSNDDDHEISDLAQPEDDPLDERGIAQRHSDTKLQTRLTSEGLQKRLLTLYYDARTLQEEQGVNILFLAIGMLRWFEDKSSDVERFAPLILVPVSLERGTAGEKFRLRALDDELTQNLSLAALLKGKFGVILPEFADGGDGRPLDPGEYFGRVADAVSEQARWTVMPNDMVLGFFSFSKFLMYRDLDAGMWPDGAGLEEHGAITALLGDGFGESEPLFGDDEPIDPHIGPEALLHIVDADSSQAAAVHEVRSGRHLVIQGPPGTGKSQTIANVIAAAVADGKRVLFAAEKMAALEVVKRRLDMTGVGDICLELHSNKANKRTVLEEIRRTWDLGRPNGRDDGAIIRQLGQSRDALNAHVARLHQPHEPSGLSPYQVIGHLVALMAGGHGSSDIALQGHLNWTRHDKEERELLLKDLAGRVADIGAPASHPWRGVGLASVLPGQLQRLLPRIEQVRERLEAVSAHHHALVGGLGAAAPVTLQGAARLAGLAARVASAPDLTPDALVAACWSGRPADVDDLVAAGEEHTAIRRGLDGVVTDMAWDVDVRQARQHIAAYGAGWLRWLNGDYKRAAAQLRSLLSSPPPKSLQDRLKLLDQLITAQKAAAIVARDDALGREAFGAAWRRDRSDWSLLHRAIAWMRGNPAELSQEIRSIAAAASDRPGLGAIGQLLSAELPEIERDLAALFDELKLDLGAAFRSSGLDGVDLQQVIARIETWTARPGDLSKWIAYAAKAGEAERAGLGALVARLADGQLDETVVIPAFEMAYYDGLLASMAERVPEIARFDGDGHTRLVQTFRDLDLKRIKLARLEVAAAHHAGMPRQDGGAGPVGVLKGEFNRKRGHMPLRQLMKKAGAAIQAIKPVFMMSPLSIAQYLEPGSVHFDMLVVDEASQIQPVDALGAIARCDQVVVVGDERQLPPTSFFAKVLAGSDEDDEEDDDAAGAAVADMESILGLCMAKGLPRRMLRWHYRSRHQSLIAVSNSQFYENRLFIVPSPYSRHAGMGLRFNHLPDAVFDRGKSGTNPDEARAVAEAVIRHAREHPDLSLGVAAFSIKQRRVILDELERLRRLNPDTETFFSAHPAEPFFVKNLENVQGDERDVIFISVGYGRSVTGYLPMNFGPLNREGGQRRLNVLISRAKQRCEVFSSITDEDIDLDRGRGQGIVAFKLFLNFARTGKLGIGTRTDREHDSIFEEQVAAALQARGYDVHPQVGLAGFFIDLAIADFERPGRYLLGIECDGASYHSSRSARDRDRLRQQVLEDHGWIIHRIWSTDWFQRPSEQLDKAIAAIEAAKVELDSREERSTARARAVPVEVVTVEREDVVEIGLRIADADHVELYREAAIAVPSRTPLHEITAGTMADLVRRIVEVEGPVHGDEIVARLRTLWGLQRAGNRIQEAVQRGLQSAVDSKMVVEADRFYSLANGKLAVRDRSQVSSAALRKPEMLPPAEICAAAVMFVEINLGATVDETVNGISKAFGFKATSAQLRQVLESAIATAVKHGELDRRGDLLAVPKPVGGGK